MHVGLCFCYGIVSAEGNVLKGVDSKYIVNKTLAILGCYAAYVGSRLATFRANLSVRSPRVKQSKGDSLTLEEETVANYTRIN
jgi:hypothetical protein